MFVLTLSDRTPTLLQFEETMGRMNKSFVLDVKAHPRDDVITTMRSLALPTTMYLDTYRPITLSGTPAA